MCVGVIYYFASKYRYAAVNLFNGRRTEKNFKMAVSSYIIYYKLQGHILSISSAGFFSSGVYFKIVLSATNSNAVRIWINAIVLK